MGLLEVDDGVLRQTQVAEVGRDGHVAHHGASDEHDFAAVFVGGVHDLLHAVHVAGEAGDDDLAGGLRERLVERRADGGLRLDESRHLGVGGIHHQQVHALFAELAEFHQIGDAVVERQLVELDVAGVDQGTGRGLHEYRKRVRDGVGHVHEFEVERADLELFASLDLDHRRVDAVFLALRLDEGERQLGADQRDVRTELEQIRHGADVVLVAVGEHQRLDLVETVLDVVEVGQDQVDARLFLFREQHAAVDEQDVAVVFDHIHVAADFAQAAQRHDAHGALAVLRRCDQHVVLLGSGGLRSQMLAAAGATAGIAVAGDAGATRSLPSGSGLLGVFGPRRFAGPGGFSGFGTLCSLAAAPMCCFLGFFCSHS